MGDNIEQPIVMPTRDALRMADEMELDLIEISPKADPPVCRIADYQKFLYQQKKKAKEIKAKQVKVVIKEIRFGPQTDDHDYNFMLNHAQNFLKEGAKVGVPNDPTNGGRALVLLEKAGLLKLKEGKGIAATKQDVVSNPKNLKIVEAEAAMLPRSLEDCDIAVINSNFAMEAKLNPAKDSLFTEKDSPYANVVAVREGDEKRPELQKLAKALTSPEVKKFIEDKYKGAVLPAF